MSICQRCYNPKNKAYKNYGGRGIREMEALMKLKKLIAHTVLDVVEVDLELALRLVKRTGIYKKGLKASFKRAQMPLSDSLLASLAEENIAAVEDGLIALLLTLREAVDAGSVLPVSGVPSVQEWADYLKAQSDPEGVSKDAN